MRLNKAIHKTRWSSVIKQWNVVELLARMLKDCDSGNKLMPPADVLRKTLQKLDCELVARKSGLKSTGEERRVGLGRAFLETCRLREFANRLVKDCRTFAAERHTAAAILYLLTGHLRPGNEPLLHDFLASVEFDDFADAVYAIEKRGPISRYYYTCLLKNNLYSREMVIQWCKSYEKHDQYAKRFRQQAKVTSYSMTYAPSTRMSAVTKRKWEASGLTLVEKHSTDEPQVVPTKSEVSKDRGKPIEVHQKPVVAAEKHDSVSTEENIKIDVEKIETEERKTNIPRIKTVTITFPDKGQLTKRRVDFRNMEEIQKKKPIRISDVRLNTATLMKEAAIILKEEEEENKKILELMVGSSNFLTYEKMIEDRIKEEKELFKLKIERLHLEGKLTEQAAILAKLRLREESRKRRKEFEEERKILVEDMNKLRESERQKIMSLVTRVKEVHGRVQQQKKSMQEQKKKQVENLSKEIQIALREAMAERRKELERKVFFIKELRAFHVLKKSLEKCKLNSKIKKEPPKTGLLCEMSLEELEARKEAMKESIRAERMRRREEILRGIREKEELLDEIERFVKATRQRQRQKRLERRESSRVARQEDKTYCSQVTSTFVTQNTEFHENEKKYRNILKEIYEIKQRNKINLGRKKKLWQQKVKNETLNFENHLLLKSAKKKSSPKINKVDSKMTILLKHANKGGRNVFKYEKLRKSDDEISKSTVTTQFNNIEDLWRIFKVEQISRRSKSKLIKSLLKRRYPPSNWMKRTSGSKISTGTLRARRRRAINSPMEVWKLRWKKFYLRQVQDVWKHKKNLPVPLVKLDDPYTKKIIARVRFYYDLLTNEKTKNQEQTKTTLQENISEILKLKAELDIIAKRIKQAKRENQLIETEPKTVKKITQKRYIFTHSDSDFFNSISNVRNYNPIDVKIPIFEEEDKEIIMTPIQQPFQEIPVTRVWKTEEEYEKAVTELISEEKEEPVAERKSILKTWKIPRAPSIQIPARAKPEKKKLFSRLMSNKFTLVNNLFGNPVFLLKPPKEDKKDWYWEPLKLEEQVEKVSRSGPGVTGLLTELSVLDEERQLRVRPPEVWRLKVVTDGPLRALLSYVTRHPAGGDPAARTAGSALTDPLEE